MDHTYECPDCGLFKAADNYDGEPKTRSCPMCKGHTGNIRYLGTNIKYYVVSDGITPILNHADGKMYDSKSSYYKALKQSGHIIVEAGMDKPREIRGDFDSRKDVAKALNQLGY